MQEQVLIRHQLHDKVTLQRQCNVVSGMEDTVTGGTTGSPCNNNGPCLGSPCYCSNGTALMSFYGSAALLDQKLQQWLLLLDPDGEMLLLYGTDGEIIQPMMRHYSTNNGAALVQTRLNPIRPKAEQGQSKEDRPCPCP